MIGKRPLSFGKLRRPPSKLEGKRGDQERLARHEEVLWLQRGAMVFLFASIFGSSCWQAESTGETVEF
eukprot:969382-Amphidinium_carterae.1